MDNQPIRITHRCNDFRLILNLIDARGKHLPFPAYDFDVIAYTSGVTQYRAWRKGNEYHNCYKENDAICVVFNNHNLADGILTVDFIAYIPDSRYPDGTCRTCVTKQLDIALALDGPTEPLEVNADLMLSYIKGDPFTYEDFTPEQLASLKGPKGDKGDAFTYNDFTAEQIAGLQKPALDAAKVADKAATNADNAADVANKAADDANKAANDAEVVNQSIAETELARVTAESQRVSAESLRESNEQSRIENEQSRVAAESQRAQSESTRVSSEQTRISNETQRVANENSRAAAEQARTTEFTTIKTEATTAIASANTAAENANNAAAEIPENIVAYTPSDDELEEIDPNLITDALRKTEQALTDSEKSQVLKNLGNPIEMAVLKIAKELFDVDLKTDAVYKTTLRLVYNDTTGLYDYKANGAIAVSNLTTFDLQTAILSWPQMRGRTYNYCFANSGLRFALLSGDKDSEPKINDTRSRIFAGSKVEAVFVSGGVSTLSVLAADTFVGASKLRLITGNLNCLSFTPSFTKCACLETVSIKYLNNNISFADSPLLSLASLSKMVTSARNEAKTITVHPAVYSKFIGSDDADYGDDNPEDWQALLTLAASKNIQFATT